MTFPTRTRSLTILTFLAAIATLVAISGDFMNRTAPAQAAFVGDVNCDSDVNAEDALAILVDETGSEPAGGCSGIADFDCDDDSDTSDALHTLRYAAGIDDPPTAGCPPIDSVTAGTNTAQLAEDLAARLSSASSDASRYRTLLRIFETIGIGVYTQDGPPVLLGEEREAGDLYLYDFEVEMLATAEGRGDESSLGNVAATLTEMGITETGGGEITAQTMRSRLLNGVDEAVSHPDATGSFLALTVLELGLERDPSYDLTTDVPLEDIRLSAVQEFLLVTDVAAYFVGQNDPVDVSESQLVENSSGALHVAPAGLVDVCERWGRDIKQIWGVGVFVVGLTAAAPVTLISALVIDGIHGMILAYSVEVRALSGQSYTHYGHETPGNPLDFRVFVNMRDDLGEIFTKCGWLAGVEFPPKGPIEGVDILWSGIGGLQRNGIVTCPANTCEKTGPDGIATLHFEPDQEHDPVGTGVPHSFNDVLVGNALYLSKHNNLLGKVNERITPKEAEINWGVAWHAPSCITTVTPFGEGTTGQGGLPTATLAPELAALPCTFTGTATGTMHYECCNLIFEDGTNSSTITFGNPTWDGYSQVVEYRAIAGEFNWQSEGTLQDYPTPCNFSQSGSESVYEGGTLWIRFQNGQLNYDAIVSSVDQERRLDCEFGDGAPIIENTQALSTCTLNNVDHFTDGSTFSGSCHRDDIFTNWGISYDHTWDFEAGSCAPSPEPVCSAALP